MWLYTGNGKFTSFSSVRAWPCLKVCRFNAWLFSDKGLVMPAKCADTSYPWVSLRLFPRSDTAFVRPYLLMQIPRKTVICHDGNTIFLWTACSCSPSLEFLASTTVCVCLSPTGCTAYWHLHVPEHWKPSACFENVLIATMVLTGFIRGSDSDTAASSNSIQL